MAGIQGASAEFQDLITSLMRVKEEDRLGSKNGAKEVMEHLFFRDIKWSEVARLGLKPPFKPKVTSPLDVSNFDEHFLQQAAVDSFVHSKLAKEEDGSFHFKGFEYNRVIAEKNELSRHDDSTVRSLTLNESVNAFDSI